jgi:hypothetical protein
MPEPPHRNYRDGDSNPMLESVFDSTFIALALLVIGAAIAWKVL